ncbi:aminopeptidase P family protein [Lachnospiraceae bacterium ZAX-1]
MIKARLKYLRQEMKKRNIDMYIVPTSDFHESEYVGDYFKARQFITGFSGSAGTAVITMEQAGLWTDGRYFIQAEHQLKNTTITLYKSGEEGVPTVKEFVKQNLKKGDRLGFDGRVVNGKMGEEFAEIVDEIAGNAKDSLNVSEDLIDAIWKDRPPLRKNPVYLLEEKYSGESTVSKMKRLRAKMEEYKATVHIITSLYDIAWLFNIRGNDIAHVPVVLSFVAVTMKACYWFVHPEVLDEAVCSYVRANHITICPYDEIYTYAASLPKGEHAEENIEENRRECMEEHTEERMEEHAEENRRECMEKHTEEKVLLDKEIVNFSICNSLSMSAIGDSKNCKYTQNTIINKKNPTELMRAVKNETELRNIRIAHRKDGVAFTKFMYWIKKNRGKSDIDKSDLVHQDIDRSDIGKPDIEKPDIEHRNIEITEISASNYLAKCRAEQEHFVDISFDTICAYKANAAMMHYSATDESNAQIKPEGFLLVDSGGHYLEGSTDITRTLAMGHLTENEKLHFTAVCRANLNLANAKFLYGCRGTNLDILARGPLWELGLDYKCGTGHGIGYLLNVHEGPNSFRWKILPKQDDSCILEAGMVTTDEPGIYLEGAYGIRTENELICIKAEKNEYGQFMQFENITYAPIDLDAILPEKMSETERNQLNSYHKMVYEQISPYFTAEENSWLKEYTRQI